MTLPFHLGQQPKSHWTPVRYRVCPTNGIAHVYRFGFVICVYLCGGNRRCQKCPRREDYYSLDRYPAIRADLGYLSITVTGFIALFPGSMLGPACAAIFAVFVSSLEHDPALSIADHHPRRITRSPQVYRSHPGNAFAPGCLAMQVIVECDDVNVWRVVFYCGSRPFPSPTKILCYPALVLILHWPLTTKI